MHPNARSINDLTPSPDHAPPSNAPVPTAPGFHPTFATVALVAWAVLTLVFGTLLVARSFGVPAFGEPFPRAWTYMSPVGALVLILGGSLVGLAVSRISPRHTLRALLVFSAVVLGLAAIALGNTRSLLVAVALALLAWMLGTACLRLVDVRSQSSLASAAIGMALGYAVIGTAVFVLSLVGGFSATSLGIVGVGLLCLGVIGITNWRQVLPGNGGVTIPLTYLEALCMGATVGAVTFALLSALTPENMFDPFRQHLPIAVEFWRQGSIEVIPHLGVSRDPVLGHALFAIGIGFGGIPAATLIHASMALIAILGVAGGAALVAGQRAAIYAALAFSTMPLLLFEIGHAYTDLFPAAFSAAAMLCVLEWIGNRRLILLVIAGILCGAGIAAKLTMVWVSLALAVVILFVGSDSLPTRGRILGLVAFAAGQLVAVPWLLRTFLASGGLPGKVMLILGFVFDRVPGISQYFVQPTDPGFQPVDVTNAGMGHAVWDVLAVPWLMAFHSDSFPDTTLGGGDIGLLLPLLLPTALLVRKDRKWWALVITSVIMYLSWWITPQQVSRHLLPTLVALAMLCGIGAARLAETTVNWTPVGTFAVRSLLLASLAGSLVLFVNNRYSQVPIAVVVGQLSTEAYIDREIPAARELRTASTTLPPDAPLLYVGKRGGAQLYTSARVVNAGQFTQELVDQQFGVTDSEVLAALDSLGVTEILWDQPVTKPEDWSSHLLSLDFLSRHARVLAVSDGYLLFALTPDASQYWNVDPATTLVKDPTFSTNRRKRSPWTSELRFSRTERAIAPRRDSVVSQIVEVTPGTPYLMVANVSCPSLWSRTTLALRWLDSDGNEIAISSQTVFASVPFNDRFVWAVAPDDAQSVSVEFGGQSRCEFARVDLFEQPTPQ